MIGQPHIVTISDVQRGIMALAENLLGAADLWPTLVSVNRLVPPYLTLYPADIYGPPVAVASLSAALPSGSTSLTLPNMPQSTNTLYFSASSASGLVAEAVSVASYVGGVFAFATDTQNSYPAGAQVQLFASYTTGHTLVLLPGNVLYVPVQTSPSLTLSSTTNLTDVFGSDIAANVSFASGDLATVQGLSTFNQRLTLALQTLTHALPLHPSFGSTLSQTVGQHTTQTQWAALIRQCLLQLPEVRDVRNVQAVPAGPTLYVSAEVIPTTSGAAIQLVNVPLTLVG